jgi:putative holliday junction resolvase
MPDRSGGALIGIDYGKRKVGLAVGHALTASARPLDPIRYSDEKALFSALADVFRQWRPARVVVGLPLGADGADSDMTRTVRDFARRLSNEHPDLTVDLHDERLTSHAAAGAFAGRREAGRARKRDAQRLDSVAAALILESWMAEHD